MDEVRRAFPEARDYLDVYERAGALGPGGPQALFAHAIHLSGREVARLAESGAARGPLPGLEPLPARAGSCRSAATSRRGIVVGLGSDVVGRPRPVDLRGDARRARTRSTHCQTWATTRATLLDPLGWLRLGTLGGARALGLADVDRLARGRQGGGPDRGRSVAHGPAAGRRESDDRPVEIVSRLIFRTHPGMVRGAWVRGRLLPAAAEAG